MVTLYLVRKHGYTKHAPAVSPEHATFSTMNPADFRATSVDPLVVEKVAQDHWVELFQPILEYASGTMTPDKLTREPKFVADGRYRLAMEVSTVTAVSAPPTIEAVLPEV